jgi:hypothetical protein
MIGAASRDSGAPGVGRGLRAGIEKCCPTAQLAGRAAPTYKGSVELAPEKSTPLVCVRKSTCVWAAHAITASARLSPCKLRPAFP